MTTGRGWRSLAAALLLPACSSGQGCTEVGAEPFVRLQAAQPPGAQVRVCLEGACEQAPWRAREVLLPVVLPREGRVALQVAVLDRGGAVRDEDAVQAEVELFAPNGPECPPQVGVVDLRREGDGYVQVPFPDAD